MRITFPICLFASFITLISPSPSWAQAGKSTRAVAQRLDQLTVTVEVIERKAREILLKQDETIEQIKNLKVISRR